MAASILVQETYTLQALPVDMHADASRRLAGLIAPGGRLLVICRSRDEDEVPDGPPWPIAYSELAPILECGLEEISVERLDDGNGNCHLRLVYQKPMLKLDDLKVHGLSPLSMELHRGECLAVQGPSGSV